MTAVQADPCQGMWRGKKLSQNQLNSLLLQHKSWLASDTRSQALDLCGTDLSQLDLRNANLSYVNLYGANLSSAKLDKAILSHARMSKTYLRWSSITDAKFYQTQLEHANFEDAKLNRADFRQANLVKANFSKADLTYANFSGATALDANFSRSKLSHAQLAWVKANNSLFNEAVLNSANLENVSCRYCNFDDANLSKVNFTSADLSNARMTKAMLKNANFSSANLARLMYQPLLTGLPDIINLSTAKNFRQIRFHHQLGLPALNELRQAYKKNGMRFMERELTTIIKVKSMREGWNNGGWQAIESTLSYVFFYVTSDYGAAPGRPLRLFLALIFLFSLPYLFALYSANRHHAIIVEWPPGRFKHWQHSRQLVNYSILSAMLHAKSNDSIHGCVGELLRNIRLALFFSLQSSFQLGWHELNISNWIMRMQTREYFLKGRGWVRALTGTQAIISAYLIVLWAFTYFGRPFEW